jgi:tRNA (guanine-N7-)-methyltransferase
MFLMKKASDLRIPFSWSERRPVLLERCLYIPGFYEKHEEWQPISWSDSRLFGNENPVAVEYCSGNGQWICEKAKQNPSMNWVAVEKRFDRARKIWARLHREALNNLFVVCGEAVVFTRHYAPLRSASQIFVNFPDPWPKLRHAKHRLIRREFLNEVEKTMKPNGEALFATDDFPYASQMLEEAACCPKWKPSFPAPHYTKVWPDFGDSFFRNLWKGKGREIYYMRFEVAE